MTTNVVLLNAILFGFLAAWAQAPAIVIRLVDVAEQVGITLLNICGGPSKDYIVEVNGNGAAVFDYDNDGDVDVLIVNGSTLANIKHGGGDQMVALFRNDGKGQFADVTLASGLKARGWGMGTCIADYDSDGFQDVYVTAFGPNVLFRNSGDGTFTRPRRRRSETGAGARTAPSAITIAMATLISTSPTTCTSAN
jgi:hypothetical protein